MLRDFKWRLVSSLSRALEPDERTAVLGDFAESHVSGWKALRDLLGLVIRRQAGLWKDWRPWLALCGLVSPFAMLVYSGDLGAQLGRYLSIWWRFRSRYGTGLTASEDIARFLFQSAALLFCSWLSGFALSSLSRRTLWMNRSLFYLVWGALMIGSALALGRGMTRASFPNNRLLPLFMGLTLYFLWPAIVCALPFRLGMRRGSYPGALAIQLRTPLATAALAVAALAVWTSGWPQAALVRWSEGQLRGGVIWPGQLLELTLLIWPALYLLTPVMPASFRCPQRSL